MSREMTRLGQKVRALRRREKLTQGELAARLGISASYLNLIENNHRPLPSALLIRLAQMFDVELSTFAVDDEGRVTAALFEALSDPVFEADELLASDVRDLSSQNPAVARARRGVYRANRSAKASADTLSARLFEGEREGRIGMSAVSSEEVGDLIQQHMNHFPALEEAAERLWRDAELEPDALYPGLVRHLNDAHRVQVRVLPHGAPDVLLRQYDPHERVLAVSELLPNRSRKMQLAHQIGLLSLAPVLDRLTTNPLLTSPQSKTLARVALANYFAAAVLMPYERFLTAARETRYDIDVIGRRFGTGFEQVAHRLTTLRRPKAEGIPFHMVRIDVAGNISKRFSASGIQIARYSGACPRWNIFAAFSTPGMIRIQLSRMPGGSAFFCIARTVQADNHGFHTPPRIHAVGLGCALERARELVYADGVNLDNQDAAVPVGVTCRLCDRTDCEQRAFPPLREPLLIDENVRGVSIYAPTGHEPKPVPLKPARKGRKSGKV
jgi:predicted transcriptional regulator/transcriptional regulator with XRE-family HTH domain